MVASLSASGVGQSLHFSECWDGHRCARARRRSVRRCQLTSTKFERRRTSLLFCGNALSSHAGALVSLMSVAHHAGLARCGKE